MIITQLDASHAVQASAWRLGSLHLLGVAGLLLALSGCVGPSRESTGSAAEPYEQGAVLEEIAARNASGTTERIYRSVLEMMPNVTFVDGAGTRLTVSDAVVVGTIVDIEPGRSFMWETEGLDAENRLELPFNDSRAQSSTLHLVFVVGETIASVESFASNPDDVVRVGLALGPMIDVKAARAELTGLGSVVLFLNAESVGFDYDASLFGVNEHGAMLGLVREDGSVSFPALDPTVAAALVPEQLTLDVLRQSTVRQEISVERVAGELVRTETG